jgi:DNA-binding response OmpR family regulator
VAQALTSSVPTLQIVVAEDDAEMRHLVVEVLAREGYQVEELPDGKALLLRVAEAFLPGHLAKRIDLVVTDVRMPCCSGLEVLSKLRNAYRTTPVVMMSAFGDQELRDQVRNLGGQFLDKPFTRQALRALVRKILETASTTRQEPTQGIRK